MIWRMIWVFFSAIAMASMFRGNMLMAIYCMLWMIYAKQEILAEAKP